MYRLNYLLILAIGLVFAFPNVNAQTVTLSGNTDGSSTASIEGEDLYGIHVVSKDIYKSIEEWQAAGPSQRVPLDRYLESQTNLDQVKVSQMLETHRENLQQQSNMAEGNTRGQDDCNCTVVTVNTAHELTPNPAQTSTNNDLQTFSFGKFWERVYIKWRHGPAHRQYLKVKGKRKPTEFESSTSGSANSSNSYAFIHFNYLCTNGALFPTNCGCEKAMNVEARYFSRMKVANKTSGIWSKASFARVEDQAVFFTYNKDFTVANPSNQISNPVVQEAAKALLARSQDATWNPQFWIELFELAATVYNVVTVEEGTFTGASITDIGNQLVSTLTTSFYNSTYGTADGAVQEDMSLLYSGVVHLYPNNTTTLAMIANGYIYGRGYGGNWEAEAESSSSYLISAVIPFDNSTPECCVEKSAKWVSGQAWGAPVSQASLQNAIGSHLTQFGLWNNVSDTNNDGNINVNNAIGYAGTDLQCNVCGPGNAPYGLTSSTIAANTRLLSWNPVLNTSYYQIRVYRNFSNGTSTLLTTLYSTTPSKIYTYNPSYNYKFEVRAVCEEGGYSDYSDFKYFGAILILHQHYTKRNGGFEERLASNVSEYTIYPNPASEVITVDINEVNNAKSVTILDLTGRTIKQIAVSGQDLINVSINELPTGVYMITLEDTLGQRSSKKFVKQ